MKILFCLFFLLPLATLAQDKVINHTVLAKESYSSIGRLYDINGRELANYNKLDYEKGLAIGQVLKVPVKAGKTVVIPPPTLKTEPVKTKPVTTPVGNNQPVYHTVAKKETLYGVSKLYNISIADIKKWNNLTVDALNEGVKIIVGYGEKKQPENTNVVAIVKKETTPEKILTEQKPPAEIKKEQAPVKITEQKPIPAKTIGNGFGGGYFKDAYVQKGGWEDAKETGTAAVFKSSSGWDDGKYYCLHNEAPQGSILKITNNANGKIIFAKVLDVIPDIKQNAGVKIRVSNAGAAELAAGENPFDCTINYSK